MTPSLLAIFAHPDDESLACGGLLARCAEDGARASLLCLTRGEHGPGGDALPAGAALADTRVRELHEAARALGVSDVTVLAHEDGMLPWIDGAALEADILAALRRTRPDVVVTFDEDGLYGHPDHVAVHERTKAVVAGLGEGAPALWFVTMPPGAMRALVAAVASSPHDASASAAPPALLGISDPDAFGALAPRPTLVLDVGRFAGRKLRALRCHRTQVAGGVFDRLDEAQAARHLGVEHYRRADVGATGPTFIDAFGAPGSRAVADIAGVVEVGGVPEVTDETHARDRSARAATC